MKKRFITAEEAIELLANNKNIHTFFQSGFGSLIGADWNREDIIDKIRKSDKIEITGNEARSIGHGIAVYNNGDTLSDVLFIETDDKKLDKFDNPDKKIQEESEESKSKKHKSISYQDCSNAMLMMWMENIVTDGEYNKIMNKLNNSNLYKEFITNDKS